MVTRTDGLGDLIVTLPVAVALKMRLPEVEVAFLVAPYTAPIARRVAEIDQVMTTSSMRGELRMMRSYHPDAIVFAKPEPRLALEALLAQIDVRIGTGYRYYSGLFTRWVYEHRRKGAKHEAQYGVNLLSPLLDGDLPVVMPELRLSPEGDAEALRKLAELGIVGEYMVIHPGSHGSAAAYEPERHVDPGLIAPLADLYGIGETITAVATVTAIDEKRRRVTLKTQCLNGDTVVIDGEATILVPRRGAA